MKESLFYEMGDRGRLCGLSGETSSCEAEGLVFECARIWAREFRRRRYLGRMPKMFDMGI